MLEAFRQFKDCFLQVKKVILDPHSVADIHPSAIPTEKSPSSAPLTEEEVEQQLNALLAAAQDPSTYLMGNLDKVLESILNPSTGMKTKVAAVRKEIARVKSRSKIKSVPGERTRISAKMRSLVEQTNRSLKDIGMEMGIPEPSAAAALCQILNEKNNPRLETLLRLAKALGVSISELM